jgi:hypothetical protein
MNGTACVEPHDIAAAAGRATAGVIAGGSSTFASSSDFHLSRPRQQGGRHALFF